MTLFFHKGDLTPDTLERYRQNMARLRAEGATW